MRSTQYFIECRNVEVSLSCHLQLAVCQDVKMLRTNALNKMQLRQPNKPGVHNILFWS